MTITALPTPPTRQDTSTFAERGDAFMAALPVFATEANALAADVSAKQSAAAGNQAAAAASESNAAGSAVTATNQAVIAQGAAQSAISAPGTSATSTDTMTISVAVKSFTIQAGKSIVVGMSVKIANTASPTNWMYGDVTAYNSGTGAITVNATGINGSGTASTWTISLSGPSGVGGSYAPKYDPLNDLGTVSSGTATINITTSELCRIQAGGNITIATTGWPTSGNLGECFVECVNFGGRTITWPTVNWVKSDGTVTTTFASNGVTLQASGTDFLLLWSRDAGTTIYGKFMR